MSSGTPPVDPDDLLRRAIEAGRSIKFGRGIVGKTTYAIVGLVVLWGGIVARASASLALDAVLISSGIIATGAVVWWVIATQRFAAANPAQALLEGAELIEYQRVEAETKGGNRIAGTAAPDDSAIRALSADN